MKFIVKGKYVDIWDQEFYIVIVYLNEDIFVFIFRKESCRGYI